MSYKTEKRIELEAKAKQLGKEWGLLDHSTFREQMHIVDEERLESATELGDVMFSSLSAENLASNPDEVASARLEYNKAVSSAMALGVCPVNCLGLAVIKNSNRIGMMFNGKYTKWKNLNHEQRVSIADSGRLNREGVDIESLLKMCSDEEADEIRNILHNK